MPIAIGIEKDEHALPPPRNHEQQRGQAGQRGANADEQILPLHAGQHQHHGGHAEQNQRRAQVGLLDDEQDKDDRHDDGAQQRVFQIAHVVETGVQKPGQKKHQHGLGHLRWLKGEVAAEANPAMNVVGAGNKENQHQQQSGDAQSGINEARGLVNAVVQIHEQQHRQHAAERPSGLAADIGKVRVKALLSHNCRCGKNHGQPDDNQQQGGEEHPFVDPYALCHGFQPRRSPTSSLKTRPRCS